MSKLQWYATADGGAYSMDRRFMIDCLDNGYYVLHCRASGLQRLCGTMSDAMKRARAAACDVPHQLT